jgi:uncharacterized cofD-like protein
MNQSASLQVVCIGGGTGLSTLLRGIKEYTRAKQDGSEIIDINRLAAIVTVSDNGGSSGKLIDEFGVLPPGDIRNCLVALSDEDEVMTRLFEHRFDNGNNLKGHSVGNLLLVALMQLNGDSFPRAIEEAARVLSVQGRILPATLEGTTLCAELVDGEIVRGESQIPKRMNREPIKRIFLSPRENDSNPTPTPDFECPANDEAVEAIQEADAIIMGPGSLYTSIMPNLAVKRIAAALEASTAMKIYVCNVMTEPGETDGYTVVDHVQAIRNHVTLQFDYALVNNAIAPEEIIKQYMREELLERFMRIRAHVDEAVDILSEYASSEAEERSGSSLENLTVLSDNIVKLSQNTMHTVNTPKVQVIYDPERDALPDADVIEEGLIYNVVIVDGGVQKRVIRHEPNKLAKVLIKLLSRHHKVESY